MYLEDNFKSKNMFFVLYFVYMLMMIVNFFMTPNPYSALHSGQAGYGYNVLSQKFFISPAYLVLLSLFLLTIYAKKLILDYKIILALFFLIISGIYTQALFTNTVTYFYNALSLILVSSFATLTYYYSDKIEIKNLKKITKILTLFLVFGACLALFFPNRYGLLPFQFSREARGEVTLWSVSGIFTIYPTISILVYRTNKSKIYMFFSLIMSIIILSTATRADLVLSLLPFIIIVLFNLKLVYKLLFGFISTIIIIFNIHPIITFLMGKNPMYNTDITNGRLVLWAYHWSHIISHPWLGSGAFFMQREGVYTGSADSEIGALMWFSENGVIFGTILMLIIIKAVFISLKLLSKGRKTTNKEMFFSVVFLSMLPNLIQSYGRIIDAQDLLFWFSVFFLCAYRKPLLPYLKL